MMEIRISKKIDVELFRSYNSGLLVLNKNGDIFYQNSKLISDAETLAYLLKDNFLFFCKKGSLHTFCKKIKEGVVLDLEGISPLFNSLNSDTLISYEYDLSTFASKIVKYNYKLGKVENELFIEPEAKIVYVDNYFIVLSNENSNVSNLSFYNHQTEITLWQFDSSELGIEKISKIMGVFGEVLVVFGHKNTAEESYLSSIPDLPIFFGISVADGSLLWQQDEVFLSGKNERDTHCRISLPFLNNETGKVIIFEAGQYIEMDALTGEICKWQNLHENPLSLNGLSMNPFFFDPSVVDENFIYFRTGIGESSRRAGVGVFDRKEQELVDLEVLTDDSENPVEMGPLKIQATKDKIYALDLKQTLHIFERE